jgi:hypothetical protein
VLNPSFEDTASMTYGYPFLLTANWWSANGFSSEYFSPHCEDLCCGSGVVLCSDEVNYLGYELAQNGNSYVGMVIYESTGETKDYSQGFLSTPLIGGIDYCVSIWISLADSSSLRSCDFQVAFSQENVNDGELAGSFNFQNVIDFDISSINTVGWTLFEGLYTAIGGEAFIYLGSNTPNSELTCVETVNDTWLWNTAYIFVDNISVSESQSCFIGVTDAEKDTISVFPNPSTSSLTVSNSSKDHLKWEIYDLNGVRHLQGDFCEQMQIDISQLTDGVYLIKFANGRVIRWLKY